MSNRVDEIRKDLELGLSFWRTSIVPVFEHLSEKPSTHSEALKDAEQLSVVIAMCTYLLKDFLELSGSMQQVEECRIKENCIFEDDTFKEFLHDIQIDADELQTQAVNVQWHLDDYLGIDEDDCESIRKAA